MQSVLARLRQGAPGVAQTPDAPSPPAAPVVRAPSPALRRLIAARAALASGRVDETRRFLQEAQLQLVFRPVGSAGDDSPAASRAASDVARALDALSANDMAQSRTYIDRAVDDSSGNGNGMPGGEAVSHASGYAPAYPAR